MRRVIGSFARVVISERAPRGDPGHVDGHRSDALRPRSPCPSKSCQAKRSCRLSRRSMRPKHRGNRLMSTALGPGQCRRPRLVIRESDGGAARQRELHHRWFVGSCGPGLRSFRPFCSGSAPDWSRRRTASTCPSRAANCTAGEYQYPARARRGSRSSSRRNVATSSIDAARMVSHVARPSADSSSKGLIIAVRLARRRDGLTDDAVAGLGVEKGAISPLAPAPVQPRVRRSAARSGCAA